MPRIAAIGDIHGELEKLQKLLSELQSRLDPEDTILFIGDYIDRGPDSRGVIEQIFSLRSSINVVTLRGNHEQMALDALGFFQQRADERQYDEDAMMWFYNGAYKTLESYPQAVGQSWHARIPEEHWAFFRTTAFEYEIGKYLFVHAGVVPSGVRWSDPRYEARLWIREEFIGSEEDFGKVVVFGHTPLKQPLFMRNKIGIDTGAVFGGPLTAVILDPEEPYDPHAVEVVQTI